MSNDKIVKYIAEYAQLSEESAGKSYDAIIEWIRRILKDEDFVVVPGLGNFKKSSSSKFNSSKFPLGLSKTVQFNIDKNWKKLINS